jgi:hypothetical protein
MNDLAREGNRSNPFYAILVKIKNNMYYEVRSAPNPVQNNKEAYFLINYILPFSEQGNTVSTSPRTQTDKNVAMAIDWDPAQIPVA